MWSTRRTLDGLVVKLIAQVRQLNGRLNDEIRQRKAEFGRLNDEVRQGRAEVRGLNGEIGRCPSTMPSRSEPRHGSMIPSGYYSPLRHHRRVQSLGPKEVKETLDACLQYGDEDTGQGMRINQCVLDTLVLLSVYCPPLLILSPSPSPPPRIVGTQFIRKLVGAHMEQFILQ